MIEAGWDGDRTSLRSPRIDSQRQTQAVLNSDIVVFHRPNDWRSLEIAKKLKAQGKKIVADNDDTYKSLEGKNLEKALQKVNEGLDEFCKFADMVTCTTETLAKEYRKLNKNVVVLPNCVDPDVWPEPLKNETDKVRIGFVGSVASNGDYNEIKDVLKELSKRDDVQLVVFALPPQSPDKNDTEGFIVREMYQSDFNFWHSLNIEWTPFVPMADYVDTLNELRLDIMIIPRKDDYFNRCKSNLKFLEASMLEIPCIVQGFADGLSPYQVNPEDRKHLLLIEDNSEWLKAINILVADKELRQKIGREAKEYVLENYSISKNIHLWENAYASLL
jgi:glycosyltransferase involved in cell wall biosynthesis